MTNKRIAREEKIADIITSHDFDWKARIATEMEQTVSDKFSEISERIKNSINKGLTDIQDKQAQSKVSVISISFLRSSLYTKSYDFCVSFHGDEMYKTEYPEKAYFSLAVLFNSESDCNLIKLYLSGKVVGVRNYEFVDSIRQLCFFRFAVIPILLPSILQNIEFGEFTSVLSEDVIFTYGGYMDSFIPIGTYSDNKWVIQ